MGASHSVANSCQRKCCQNADDNDDVDASISTMEASQRVASSPSIKPARPPKSAAPAGATPLSQDDLRKLQDAYMEERARHMRLHQKRQMELQQQRKFQLQLRTSLGPASADIPMLMHRSQSPGDAHDLRVQSSALGNRASGGPEPQLTLTHVPIVMFDDD
ncbi:unnamed protein product [Effrenium voratum]|nr:unnamed protein product [Effrenium voratum]